MMTIVKVWLDGANPPIVRTAEMLASGNLVGFRDQVDMVFNHLKTDHGIAGWIYDGLPLGKAGRRTVRILFETNISASIDRLHDDRAIVKANQ